jgi:hypothetical protein
MGGALPPLKSAPSANMDFINTAEPNLGPAVGGIEEKKAVQKSNEENLKERAERLKARRDQMQQKKE